MDDSVYVVRKELRALGFRKIAKFFLANEVVNLSDTLLAYLLLVSWTVAGLYPDKIDECHAAGPALRCC